MNINKNEAINFTSKLGTGWNLGNTFDAFDNNFSGDEPEMEVCWCGVKTSGSLIKAIAEKGFKTIRIPVSWHNHVDEDCRINAIWMNRVEEGVKQAFDCGLYVILNCHHDTDENYCYPRKDLFEKSSKYISAVWQQIAERFQNYDERLIFEGMNEPRLRGTKYEWNFNPKTELCRDAMECINKLNQIFTDVVRSCGAFNKTRYLMVPAYAAKPDVAASEYFKLPEDSAENRIIVSAHAYSPFSFCLESPGTDRFSEENAVQTGEIKAAINCLYEKFIANGVPVIMGEFGAQDKHNIADRVRCVAYYIKAAREAQIPCCIWDNSYFEKGDEFFGLINRETAEWVYPEIADAAIMG